MFVDRGLFTAFLVLAGPAAFMGVDAAIAQAGPLAPCPSGDYGVSVIPDGASRSWPQYTNSHPDTFTVTNTSPDCTQVHFFTYTVSGPISGVSLNRSNFTLLPGNSIEVIATYNVGAPGSGVLTVKSTIQYSTVWDEGYFNVTVLPPPPPPQISITPKGGSTSAPQSSSGNPATFRVTETGGGTGTTVTFDCMYDGTYVTGCPDPTSVWVDPGQYRDVVVTYSTGVPGSGTLTLRGQWASSTDDGWFNVTVTDPIAPTARLVLPTGDVFVKSPTIQVGWCDNYSLNAGSRWIMVNGADRTSSFDYAPGTGPPECPAWATSTAAAFDSLVIGSNTVQAYICDNGGTCTNPAPTFVINRVQLGAPAVTLVNHNRDNQDRSLCLTTPAGDAAAVQCGDLLAYHAMPAFRSMGSDRSLTLVYSSATAEPRPRVAVQAALASGEQPQSVYAELTVASAIRASATFSSWAPGTTRQLVLAFDASAFTTGLYPFGFLVRSNYSGGVADAVVNDTLIIVNREASEFGAGWHPAGVERLFLSQPGGSILWVGGDGSARVYRSLGGGQWQAPAGAFRDLIVQVSGNYERRAKHGVTVTFDAAGRHISTRNRLGHVTTFTWDANGKLIKVKLPGPGGE